MKRSNNLWTYSWSTPRHSPCYPAAPFILFRGAIFNWKQVETFASEAKLIHRCWKTSGTKEETSKFIRKSFQFVLLNGTDWRQSRSIFAEPDTFKCHPTPSFNHLQQFSIFPMTLCCCHSPDTQQHQHFSYIKARGGEWQLKAFWGSAGCTLSPHNQAICMRKRDETLSALT